MWDRDNPVFYAVSEGEELEVWEAKSNQQDFKSKHYCCWLIRFDRPIAMMIYMVENGVPVLSMIEVRPTVRGYGLGRWLIDWVQTHVTKATVYSNGEFTPEGARSLQEYLPVTEGRISGVYFKSLSFVNDWDFQILRLG